MFSRVQQVPASQWDAWVDENDATVLDVREPREWAGGTLPGAKRISLGSLPAEAHQLDKSKAILVVCRSGSRSQRAARFLAKAGYDVANMRGGMIALGHAG